MALLLIAGLFLPLFPLSIVLNTVVTRLRHPAIRFVLLLLWPQVGIMALQAAGQLVPAAFVPWALLSAGFYALRLLTVRDLGRWASLFASSVLALVWVLANSGAGIDELRLFALWFSLPAALLALLTGPLARRFGAAYAGLPGGLAGRLPRFSGVLILVVLAGVATPPFPTFFAMLDLLQRLAWPAVLGTLVIWLIWGWAAIRLVQDFVVGPVHPASINDIGRPAMLAYASLLAAFVAAGLYLTGGSL